MPECGPGEITELLLAWRGGEATALDKLIPLIYAELRRLAHRYMRNERLDHTLETGALINEAYLRLVDSSGLHVHDRAHFLALSAQVMRRILVESARSRRTVRRGADVRRVPLEVAAELQVAPNADLVQLDEALTELAASSPRRAQVIELRYFGGLSVEETATVLGVSEDTVHRDWRLAEQAYSRAQQNTGAATSVLLKLMADPATPAAGRIRAALGIFGLAREALDLDIETRVSALERAAESAAK